MTCIAHTSATDVPQGVHDTEHALAWPFREVGPVWEMSVQDHQLVSAETVGHLNKAITIAHARQTASASQLSPVLSSYIWHVVNGATQKGRYTEK